MEKDRKYPRSTVGLEPEQWAWLERRFPTVGKSAQVRMALRELLVRVERIDRRDLQR